MCRPIPTLIELSNENREYRSGQSDQAEQPEAIEECKDACLLLHHGLNLRHGPHSGISRGITVIDKAVRNARCTFRKGRVEVRDVRD